MKKTICFPYIPALRLGKHAQETFSFALFGYANDWLCAANEKRGCLHVTGKALSGGGVRCGARIKSSGRGTAHSV